MQVCRGGAAAGHFKHAHCREYLYFHAANCQHYAATFYTHIIPFQVQCTLYQQQTLDVGIEEMVGLQVLLIWSGRLAMGRENVLEVRVAHLRDGKI